MSDEAMRLEDYSRLQLARLCRELMLAAQFNSRTGYAALRINHGDAAYKDTAIANWMAASPVYTRRMQRTMGFAGGADVPTIFKGLQLDCGFTHQYFDVHFDVESRQKGRFWLQSCGALLEAEPRGEDAVKVMCHDIEDPTFDATAAATNPQARMRPVHRPPRSPEVRENTAHREPHCEWIVEICDDEPALNEPPLAITMAATQLGSLPIVSPHTVSSDGLRDYAGAVQEQLCLECFSQPALAAIYREFAVQVHMLINSLLLVATQTYGKEAAQAIAEFQMAGTCWVVSERLKAVIARDLQGEGGASDQSIDEINLLLGVLRIHPAFQPADYFNASIEKLDAAHLRISLGECPAASEELPCSWFALLQRGLDAGLDAMVKGVDLRACITRDAPDSLCWTVALDVNEQVPDEAQEEPFAVQVAKGTVLYQTKLEDHIQLLNV